MAQTAAKQSDATQEDFEALLQETLGDEGRLEGTVLKGDIIDFEGDDVLVDVGLKSEGRVAMKEFSKAGEDKDLKIGDEVEVFLERMEDKHGEAVLSRDKARREEAWNQLEKAFNDGERVTGHIFGRVKGGFTVDLSGAVAFLPGSQVDIRPVRDVSPLMGTPQPFQILKMDRSRGNIVVSRRAVLEETRAEQRSELIKSLKEGQVKEGVVKNITDYGAFVDLGGVDGLLHVTDIAWKRVGHPSDVLSIGQTVTVQVIRFNPETQRISLGMKQLEADPWEGAAAKYPVGTKFKGRVTNITDYGAFVELEAGIEGLVHVSEMSWTKKNVHPGKIISTSQEVEVMILDVDEQKRRISLGLKQCMPNPWQEFKEKYPPGSIVEGEVKNTTEFGLFVGLPGEIDGMVHLSDLSWDTPGEEAIKAFKKGETTRVKVLDVDPEKERISLGIKQLEEDPFSATAAGLKKGQVVTGTVHQVTDGGIEVKVGEGALGFIRKAELSRDRSEQRPDRFAQGEKVDAKVTSLDKKNRKITLSIKQREIDEEKQAMAEYGSADTGASLGEILGPAMTRAVKDTVKEGAQARSRQQQAEAGEAEAEPAAEPEAAEAPEAEAAEAAEGKAASGKAAAKSGSAKRTSSKSTSAKSTASKSAAGKAAKSTTAKSAAAKSGTSKAASSRSASGKTTASKASGAKSSASKSASGKAAASKSSGAKATSSKSGGAKAASSKSGGAKAAKAAEADEGEG